MKKLLILCSLLFILVISSLGQTTIPYVFYNNTAFGSATSGVIVNNINTGATYHKAVWTVTGGTFTTATLKIDSCTTSNPASCNDGDILGATDAHLNGNSGAINFVATYSRVRLTVYTAATGTPVLNVIYTGYINNPAAGGGVTNSAGDITVPNANKLVVVAGAGDVKVASSPTPTELGYLGGVTSAIQGQIDNKQNSLGATPTSVTMQGTGAKICGQTYSSLTAGDIVGLWDGTKCINVAPTIFPYAVDPGATGDSYAITLTYPPTTYATGQIFTFSSTVANTGTASLKVNTLAAITIKKVVGGITTDLNDNDIRANQMVQVVYDGTNFQMISVLGNIGILASKVWLPAASCQNATAILLWDTPTTNPAVAACDTGTNTQKGVADFADGANTLSMQQTLALPSDWTGALDGKFKWYTSATSGSVVWQIATICVADGATDDPAFNTASTVTDAAKGVANQLNDATITNITTTGCTAGSLMHIKIFRDPTNASDTLAATARLIGIDLTLRRFHTNE